MKRLSAGKDWTLFNPVHVPGLSNLCGSDFEEVYTQYEDAGRGKAVSVQRLWSLMISCQLTGRQVGVVYKDPANGG